MHRLYAALGLTLLAGPCLGQGVLTYHNSTDRHGAYKVPGLTLAAAATVRPLPGFSASFTGDVYAQPLYWHPAGAAFGELIVATESNAVLALNADSGAVVWQTQLAPAVALKNLPCGDIDPEGITGAPVIDPGTGTLYLNALTEQGGVIAQKLYALSLADGAVVTGWPIDVSQKLAARKITFASTNQGERGALLLTGGSLYVAYGGKAGDCLPYHGTVLQLDPATRALQGVWQTGASGGGIWAQGAIAAVGKSLYITTGNTFGATSYGDGESVVHLTAGLAHSTHQVDYYAPANWATLDAFDQDLGGTEALPVNLATGGGKIAPRVIAFGKDGKAYLLDRNKLGGIGGPATIVPVSNQQIITAAAIYSTPTLDSVVFTNGNPIGCSHPGLMMLSLTPSGSSPITTAWCAPYSGNGAPIITTTDGVSNPIVWVVGAEGDAQLHGFNALTGAAVYTSPQGLAGLHRFQTLISAGGRLYVAGNNAVYGFVFTPG